MGIASHLHFISSFWVFSSVVGIFWNCHRKGAFVSLLNTTPSPRSPSAADHSGAQIRGALVRRPRRACQEDFQIQSCQDAADSLGAAQPKHEPPCLVSPLWRWYKASSVAATQLPGCPVVIWHRLSPPRWENKQFGVWTLEDSSYFVGFPVCCQHLCICLPYDSSTWVVFQKTVPYIHCFCV